MKTLLLLAALCLAGCNSQAQEVLHAFTHSQIETNWDKEPFDDLWHMTQYGYQQEWQRGFYTQHGTVRSNLYVDIPHNGKTNTLLLESETIFYLSRNFTNKIVRFDGPVEATPVFRYNIKTAALSNFVFRGNLLTNIVK